MSLLWILCISLGGPIRLIMLHMHNRGTLSLCQKQTALTIKGSISLHECTWAKVFEHELESVHQYYPQAGLGYPHTILLGSKISQLMWAIYGWKSHSWTIQWACMPPSCPTCMVHITRWADHQHCGRYTSLIPIYSQATLVLATHYYFLYTYVLFENNPKRELRCI